MQGGIFWIVYAFFAGMFGLKQIVCLHYLILF